MSVIGYLRHLIYYLQKIAHVDTIALSGCSSPISVAFVGIVI